MPHLKTDPKSNPFKKSQSNKGQIPIETSYRNRIISSDLGSIQEIIDTNPNFSPEEAKIAIELAQESLLKGDQSGYHFLLVEQGEKLIGYACFGRIPCTGSSFDLYWIAIHKEFQGLGLGKRLLKRVESLIVKMGGNRIYIETSSRNTYEIARRFYRHCGYLEAAVLKDFYSEGDDKVIFVKQIKKSRPKSLQVLETVG